jgi:hypothetical protein
MENKRIGKTCKRLQQSGWQEYIWYPSRTILIKANLCGIEYLTVFEDGKVKFGKHELR